MSALETLQILLVGLSLFYLVIIVAQILCDIENDDEYTYYRHAVR